ncbi:MAG: nucleotidyltransferase family protein, partial [Pyrinomonadaceae bacterium]
TVYPLHSPFGIVGFDAAKCVHTFDEKPLLPYWINIGFMLCEPEALNFLKPDTDMPDFLSSVAAAGRLFAHQHTGQHLTVNTEKDRELAETQMIEFFTHPNGQVR